MSLRRYRHLVLVVLTLSVTAAPLAQEQVTIVRRNGQRLSGRFEDWNRPSGTVYLRVNQSEQATLPIRDVLLIEVGGSAGNLPLGEVQAAAGADHVLVTRRGEVLTGRLTNIEGGEGSSRPDEPRTITFQAGGERRFGFSDVARLYLGNFPQPSGSPGPEPSPGTSPAAPFTLRVRVPANQPWTPTNIMVREGDLVQFSVRGQVQLSADPEDMAVSAGSLRGRRAPNAPAPQYLAGALLGRVGRGGLFPIGDQTDPLPMPGAGPLFLGINDDAVGDNQGALDVSIRVIPRRR
jgi:hypothetical protein